MLLMPDVVPTQSLVVHANFEGDNGGLLCVKGLCW